jgi:hypothetical protein
MLRFSLDHNLLLRNRLRLSISNRDNKPSLSSNAHKLTKLYNRRSQRQRSKLPEPPKHNILHHHPNKLKNLIPLRQPSLLRRNSPSKVTFLSLIFLLSNSSSSPDQLLQNQDWHRLNMLVKYHHLCNQLLRDNR